MKWSHYIGGYYSPEKFIREAERKQVSRRVPARIAKAMSFGDEVICLAWNKGDARAFAQFVISEIRMPHEVAMAVAAFLGRKVIDTKAETKVIVRECGMYISMSSHIVSPTTTMKEIVEAAEKAEVNKKDLYFLIGGWITVVYPALPVQPAPKFYRGFAKVGEDSPLNSLDIKAGGAPNRINGVSDYAKRRTKQRRDLQMRLANI